MEIFKNGGKMNLGTVSMRCKNIAVLRKLSYSVDLKIVNQSKC